MASNNLALSDVSSDPEDSFERIDNPSELAGVDSSPYVPPAEARREQEPTGYYCDVCDCTLMDACVFLDHINSADHQTKLGLVMSVKRSSLEEVKERLLTKRIEKESSIEAAVETEQSIDAPAFTPTSGEVKDEDEETAVAHETSFEAVEETNSVMPAVREISSDDETSSDESAGEEDVTQRGPMGSPVRSPRGSSSISDASLLESSDDDDDEVDSPDPLSPRYSPRREWVVWAEAVQSDDVDRVEEMMGRNEEIVLRREQKSGSTGLHMAAEHGSLTVCHFLVSLRPALIKELDTEGNQPLHLAVISGCYDVAVLLLSAGSSPTLQNYEKETPIELAACARLKRALTNAADERGEAYGLDPLSESREISAGNWWQGAEMRREEERLRNQQETARFDLQIEVEQAAPAVENNRPNAVDEQVTAVTSAFEELQRVTAELEQVIENHERIAGGPINDENQGAEAAQVARSAVNEINVELAGNRRTGKKEAQQMVEEINRKFLEKAEEKKDEEDKKKARFGPFLLKSLGIVLILFVGFGIGEYRSRHTVPTVAITDADLMEMGKLWFDQECRSGRLIPPFPLINIYEDTKTGRLFMPHTPEDEAMRSICREAVRAKYVEQLKNKKKEDLEKAQQAKIELEQAQFQQQLRDAKSTVERLQKEADEREALLTRATEENKRIVKLLEQNSANKQNTPDDKSIEAMKTELRAIKEKWAKAMRDDKEKKAAANISQKGKMRLAALTREEADRIAASMEKQRSEKALLKQVQKFLLQDVVMLKVCHFVMYALIVLVAVGLAARRAPRNGTPSHSVVLKKSEDGFGLKLQGAFVKEVLPTAEVNGALSVGDEIIAVAKVNVETMRPAEIHDLIRKSGEKLKIWVRANPGRF